jgi:LacI family transcriptional regulator, repressor for deo operon, udp, cdd, tsx, nupC, and nupG
VLQKTPKGSVTIKQLAKLLDMAHSTVSRALNDHPAISDETKKRIRAKARQLGYVPNSAARILRTARSGIIGLVIPDIKNEFFSTVAKTIAAAATEHSWQIVLATTDDQPDRERIAVRSLLKAQAEGVIIASTAEPQADTVDMIGRLRAVQLLRSHPRILAPSIKVADRAGIAAATAHLQELGHVRIGYIGPPAELSTGNERLQGFLQRFPDSAVAAQRVQLCLPRSRPGADAFMRLWSMPEPPTAVVLGSPEFALGATLAANEHGIRIPDDVSLVGFGDSDLNRVLCGGLTAMFLPEQEIADACVELMRSELEKPRRASQEHKRSNDTWLFHPTLVTRNSSRAYVPA